MIHGDIKAVQADLWIIKEENGFEQPYCVPLYFMLVIAARMLCRYNLVRPTSIVCRGSYG